jgi:hypothetical protein
MSADLIENYSMSESDKFGLVLSELERFQKELHLAKCEIKTTIREVALHQMPSTIRLLNCVSSFTTLMSAFTELS